jgi:hypothetical protein
MSTSADSDKALGIRFSVVSLVAAMLMFANVGVNVMGMRARQAAQESYAARNAEVEARIEKTRAVLAESEQMRQEVEGLTAEFAKLAGAKTVKGSSATSQGKRP